MEKKIVDTKLEQMKSMMVFNSEAKDIDEEIIYHPCGCDLIDCLLGGGIPEGKIIELSGYNSTGKSEILQLLSKSFVDRGGLVYILDGEVAWSKAYLRKKGIDTERVIIDFPNCLEEALVQIEAILNKDWGNVPVMIGIDSIASLGSLGEKWEKMQEELTLEEIKAVITSIAKKDYPEEAAIWAKWFRKRKVGIQLKRKKITLVATNQTRKPLNAGMFLSDSDLTTFGGEAWKFFSTSRIYIKRGKKIVKIINGIEKELGYEMKLFSLKARLQKPRIEIKLPFSYNGSIQNSLATMLFLNENKVLEKSGKGYIYKDQKLTEKEFIQKLEEDKDFKKEILDLIYEII